MRVVKACRSLLVAVLSVARAGAATPPSPRDALDIEVGRDRVLASYTETRSYLETLAKTSEHVLTFEIGRTIEGRPIVAAAISAPANLAQIDRLKRSWASLADPRGLADADREALITGLPSCALIVAGIHSDEVAGPQAALLFAHRLAAAPAGGDEASWLERTVVLLVPSVNPDGQEDVVAWYRRTMSTPAEGAAPPFLYHRYAGHDNNRDFVYLTQPESRALNRLAYRDWHPQVFLDLHQMGPAGPRQFVPPFAEPLAPNVHPLVWRMTSLIGAWMSLRLEEQGKAGVVSGWMFDGNWIGGTRNTGWWKNVFGILTETAGSALATPVYVDEADLRGGGKGLREYRAQVTFPNPWRGGRWGLSDAVAYQLEVMSSLVEFAAVHGEELRRGVASMAAEAVERGRRHAPRAWVVPVDGPDPGRARDLVNVLLEAGAEALVAGSTAVVDGVALPAGTVVFPAAQPLRQYLLEVLEPQHFPEVAQGGGDIALPYDITAWTMPLYLGVEVRRAERELSGDLEPLTAPLAPADPPAAVAAARAVAISSSQLAAFAAANRALSRGHRVARLVEPLEGHGAELAAGTFVILAGTGTGDLVRETGAQAVPIDGVPAGTAPVRQAVIGVYHPNTGLEDAGWCRWVLERVAFPVRVITTSQLARGGIAGEIDVLVVPPMSSKLLVEGPVRRLVEPPKEYRGGIGKEGVEAIKKLVSTGGTVIAFAGSAEWLADAVEVPVANALKDAERGEFFAPGALLDLEVDPATRLGWGMPSRAATMVDAAVAFETSPSREGGRVIAARFPDSRLLLSGWIRGEARLRRRAAAIEVRKDEGRVVLFSFAPFFRGQTAALFPLLYNAVMLEMMDHDFRRR